MRIFERLRERYGREARQRAAELHAQQARLLAEIKASHDHQAGECCGCSIGHEAAAEPAAAHRR
ncbi:ABC-type nickel/cobalt efflux system permease component RcnA [Rhodopseudomonas rhenobacensis]|uniref:ABC-type nickel/cobalt efflux system permease component RcnA n=1 Tax=Rhodopseudomonas rhenobacensis TaxID=87461 RepID=A0A7W8DXN6_9BRAD|nr:hypothetical protein [Rhodopseudomonas rhenobacensis]MBB5046414.1 ABC-type nickel/cobalt efflux system permease component RcnA [Rhodopseudomonas rhenobacensis]